MTFSILLFAAFATSAPSRIPAVQPQDFIGAAGVKVKAELRAEPTSLTLDQTILFSLILTGVDNAAEIKPPDISRFGDFSGFIITATTDTPKDNEAPKRREFRYRLQPRSVTVKQIPPLTFTFYKPPPTGDGKGAFATILTDSIPLQVSEPKKTERVTPLQPLDVPPWLEATESVEPFFVSKVLRWLWIIGPLLTVVVIAFGPKLFPNAARRAALQRNRAARLTLERLDRLRSAPTATRLAEVSKIMLDYLNLRCGLPRSLTTAVEVRRWFAEMNIGRNEAETTSDWLIEIEALRFSPAGGDETTVIARAEELLYAWEQVLSREQG